MNTRETFCPGRGQEEDILPRKRPKACILKKNIESSEAWNQQHRIQRSCCWSLVNTTILSWTKSQHQRSLQTRKNHPWASQSEQHGIHTFCNRKTYRILRPDLDSNSSRHVHLNEHQEDILPRKRPKACILGKFLESSETWNQQHRIQRKFCALFFAKVLCPTGAVSARAMYLRDESLDPVSGDYIEEINWIWALSCHGRP